MTLAIVLVIAYLLGSIPSSYIVVHYRTGRDIRTLGNGNPGMMNVLDNVGLKAALAVAGGDIGKGMAAVTLAYAFGLDHAGAIGAALVAVAGHDFSIFMRLHGGNGMATAIGGLLALVPLAAFPAAGIALLIAYFGVSRRIAGIVGLLLVPTLTYWLGLPLPLLAGVVLLLTVTALKVIRFEGFTPARIRPPR